MYRASLYWPDGARPITKHEVERATPATIYYALANGHEFRELRRSNTHRWYDTWGEARDYLIHSHREQNEAAKDQLGRTQERLNELFNLQEE